MSFFDKICVWLGGGSSRGGSKGKCVYIVDAASFEAQNGKRSQLSPRVQIDMLHRLGIFAKKEQLEIYVVFEDEPLRKVPDKSKFHEVFAWFAGSPAKLPPLVIKLLKTHMRRKEVTVITSDRQLEEQVLANGGGIMRCSTFRKAVDAGGGGGADKSRPSRRQSRRRTTRKPRQEEKKGNEKNQDIPDAVHELIDVVEEPEPAPVDGNVVVEEPAPEDDVDGNR